MRILQIIDSLPATSGGARFVSELTLTLTAKNVNCDLLLIDGNESHFFNDLRSANVKIIVLDSSVKNRYRFNYVRKIAQLMGKYDIIHVHIFPASYLVALASLFTKKFIVFTEHNAYNRRAVHPIFKFAEKFIYSRFIKVVGISPAVLTFVDQHLKINKGKMVLIENGVNLNAITSSKAAKRLNFSLSESDIVLLMSARFADQKDQMTLIKALSDLPADFKLLFAGDGPNLDKCMLYAQESGVFSRINFLGARSDVYEIIQMSDINILSSHYEGFGLSAVEAMAAAKPVVATNVPGVAEVVDDAGLLFEVGDVQRLKALILKLGQEKEFYHEIAMRCLERSKLYDIENMTEKYLQLYKEIYINNYGTGE
ncbi:glycosyltransferase [Chryseobacterium sp. cx-311]|uniref:glycosyltransferase n=1 Tax=Marnyiella aurantia TaxID=2758037 RepID=UPI001AE18C84|nr:glycosyltransferase [Marnyiella aurantia]MBP0612951.1 glycosyltransferase [Marnyiella aurantia]